MNDQLTLPNFLIIGAAKCGTTSLAYYLSQHPDVFIPKEKEAHFFNRTDMYRKGVKYYSNKFFNNTACFYARGEATPAYISQYEDVIPRIKETFPKQDVKFIVLLRDPVARAWSHYLHMVRNCVEDLSIEEALVREGERCLRFPDKWFGYFRDGLYGQQLKIWMSKFPKGQFLIIDQVDLIKNTQSVMVECFKFLEVDPAFVLHDITKKNMASEPRNKMFMKMLSGRYLGGEYLKQLISPYLRRKVLVKLRSLNTKVTEATRKNIMPVQVKRYLEEKYIDDIQLLEDVACRSFAHWTGHVSSKKQFLK